MTNIYTKEEINCSSIADRILEKSKMYIKNEEWDFISHTFFGGEFYIGVKDILDELNESKTPVSNDFVKDVIEFAKYFNFADEDEEDGEYRFSVIYFKFIELQKGFLDEKIEELGKLPKGVR